MTIERGTPPIDEEFEERTYCPECGSDMDWVECWQIGCDEGWITDLHEIDPLWYDEDDIERCDICHGDGGWSVCFVCHPGASG